MDKSTYLVILGLVSFGYLNNNLLPLDNNIPYVCTCAQIGRLINTSLARS